MSNQFRNRIETVLAGLAIIVILFSGYNAYQTTLMMEVDEQKRTQLNDQFYERINAELDIRKKTVTTK